MKTCTVKTCRCYGQSDGDCDHCQGVKTRVVFRIFPKKEGGDVIALFPAIAGTVGKPWTCSSYLHIGQHGFADLHGLTRVLRLATKAEYKDLAAELVSLGYDLEIVTRTTTADTRERERQLAMTTP